jgi:3-mercaptopyruvate sulfurtransferase SseA
MTPRLWWLLRYFALSLTGRDDARLYDGSLTEWSAHPELPLATG